MIHPLPHDVRRAFDAWADALAVRQHGKGNGEKDLPDLRHELEAEILLSRKW